MKFNNVQNKIIEMLNEFEDNDGILTEKLLAKFSKEMREAVTNDKAIIEEKTEKEYDVSYYVVGNIKVTGYDAQDALRNFHDRCGFANDDLYENLNHDFKVNSIVEVKNG